MKKIFFTAIFTFFTVASYAAELNIEMLNKRADGQRMVYSLEVAKIAVGDVVNWLPVAKGHNVEFKAGPAGVILPKKSAMNQKYSYKFEQPGIYFYWCTPHKAMGMIGLVIVGDDLSNKADIAKVKVFGKSKSKLAKLLQEL
jgi:pseudoazurin